MIVLCPTRTPGTSVMAFEGPGRPSNGTPSCLARFFGSFLEVGCTSTCDASDATQLLRRKRSIVWVVAGPSVRPRRSAVPGRAAWTSRRFPGRTVPLLRAPSRAGGGRARALGARRVARGPPAARTARWMTIVTSTCSIYIIGAPRDSYSARSGAILSQF